MVRQTGFSLIELTVVVIIIAILATVFLRYAEGLVEEAEQVSLESISNSFANIVGSLRGQWVVAGRRQPAMVELDNQLIYLNEFGWPANARADSDPASDSQTADECRQLWEAITQNPTPATIDPARRTEQRLHISAPDGKPLPLRIDLCRTGEPVF